MSHPTCEEIQINCLPRNVKRTASTVWRSSSKNRNFAPPSDAVCVFAICIVQVNLKKYKADLPQNRGWHSMIVSLNGPDGSGKTTQISAIAAVFPEAICVPSIRHFDIEAPADCDDAVRDRIYRSKTPEQGMLALLAAYRRRHQFAIAMIRGAELVLLDRGTLNLFSDAVAALLRETALDAAFARVSREVRDLLPLENLAVYLDVNEAVCATRDRRRGNFDNSDFVSRSREALCYARSHVKSVAIDGSQSIASVTAALVELIGRGRAEHACAEY